MNWFNMLIIYVVFLCMTVGLAPPGTSTAVLMALIVMCGIGAKLFANLLGKD